MYGDASPWSHPPLLDANPANQKRRKSRIRKAEIASESFAWFISGGISLKFFLPSYFRHSPGRQIHAISVICPSELYP